MPVNYDDPIYDEIDAALEAGDMERFMELSKQAPLPPEVANAFKFGFGAEYMKNCGFNLSAAEEKYGKDWLAH